MSWRVVSVDRFLDSAALWDELNAAAGGPPFLRAAFISRALDLFGTGEEVVAIHSDDVGVDAITILQKGHSGTWHTFQPSQLPLGAWLMAPGRTHAALAAELFEYLPGFPLLIGITQQDPHMSARPAEGGLVETLSHQTIGWIPIDGDFETYWNQRGRHLRQNLRTQYSRLEKAGISRKLHVLSHAKEMGPAIARYARLESAGWKGAEGTALGLDEVQARFYCAVLEDYCAMQSGTVFELRFGERTVAMDLCIESDGVIVLLKTTYDETVMGYSPSSILKALAYERLFARADVHRCEFFGPFMWWTSRWTQCARVLYHVNVFRWSRLRALRQRVRSASYGPPAHSGLATASASPESPILCTSRSGGLGASGGLPFL